MGRPDVRYSLEIWLPTAQSLTLLPISAPDGLMFDTDRAALLAIGALGGNLELSDFRLAPNRKDFLVRWGGLYGRRPVITLS